MLADTARLLIWMTNAEDKVIYLNQSASALIGQTEEMHISEWNKYVHPDDLPRVQPIVQQARAARGEYQIEYRIVKSDGTVRWMMGSAAPRFSDAGEYLGYNGFVQDVTSRHELVERLSKSEARHRLLTENSFDLISHYDPSGIVLYVSPSYTRLLGYQPSDLVGTRVYDHLHPDDVPAIQQEIFRQLRDGGEGGLIELRKRHKDGHYIWMGTLARVLVDPQTKQRSGIVAVSRDITLERQVKEELRKSRDQLSSVLESISDAFFAVDQHWRVTYVNQKTAEFIGRKREDLVGNRIWEAVPEVVASSVAPYYQEAMTSRKRVFFETYYEPASAWLEVRVYPNDDGLAVFFHDISSRREAEAAIRESESRYREVIEMTPVGYVLADAEGVLRHANPALCRISGYGEDELTGRSMTQLFTESPCGGALAIRHGATSVQDKELVLVHKDGKHVYVLVNASIKRDADGNAISLTAFITDITERKHSEARLEQLATHDTLTNLPNRVLLNDRLQQMLDRAPRGSSVAVMFIDLDRFKEVNDSMGHDCGDVLLCEVAARLHRNMRPSDVVARLGGDEFVVAAHCSEGPESAAAIADKLLASLAVPVDIGGQEIFVSASIGISLYPQDGTSKELLFQSADTAMYRAKAAGRNGFRFFEAEMSAAAKTRMALEHSLRRALERNEFELHYQPRMSLKSMAVVGMEALIRWNHPSLGRVSPLEFIPIAEERGLIEPIGLWVLQEACAQTRRLMGKFGRPLRISVNLSARQLKSTSLREQVKSVLKSVNLPPHLLELELTESALIEDIELSAGVLKELKELGVVLSVDDFGTGYSGLAYLQRFPLDILKLDRSFVEQQVDGSRNFRFIKAFIDMAHALNLSVVAEGVESVDTLQFLRVSACDEAQGYLFAKPLSIDDLETFLSRLPAPAGAGNAALPQQP